MANTNGSVYQPVPTGGVLGFVQRLFVATPVYRGDRQPQPRSGGLLGSFFSGTPVYEAAPPLGSPPRELSQGEPLDLTSSSGDVPDCDRGPLTIVIARD